MGKNLRRLTQHRSLQRKTPHRFRSLHLCSRRSLQLRKSYHSNRNLCNHKNLYSRRNLHNHKNQYSRRNLCHWKSTLLCRTALPKRLT